MLDVDRVSGRVKEPGIGARITFNLTRLLGLEGEINFFPNQRRNTGASNQEGGRITQGLFGAKLGFRTEKIGVFGKLRPGFQSFGRVKTNVINTTSSFDFEYGRLTHFALVVGGILKFYPSRRTLVRFDLGEKITGHDSQSSAGTVPVTIPTHFHHNFQLSVG